MSALILPLAMFLTWTAGGFDGDLPNRDGVVCPEGFDDAIEFSVIELPNRIAAHRACAPYVSPTTDRIRGCAVDLPGGRMVIHAAHDYATRAEEMAHAACPSLGYDSFALHVIEREHSDCQGACL